MALPSIIDDTGHERFLGNIEPPKGLMKAWPIYGDVPETPMVPKSQWDDVIAKLGGGPEDDFNQPIHDQDGIGMCNCSATAGAMEDARAMQGLPYVALSGGDLYKRIHVGGGDNGSLLEDGLAEAMKGGVASVKVVPYLDWRGSHSEAGEDRKLYRVLEAFLCPTFEHCFSAVAAKFRLITGVEWYSNYKTDGDGWLPAGRGSGGGHAIKGYKPTKRGSTYGIWHSNSWGRNWGLNGRMVIPQGAYGRAIGGWWAVRAVTDEGGVVPPIVA